MDFSKTNENEECTPLPIVKINREECAKNEIMKALFQNGIFCGLLHPHTVQTIE